MIVTGLIVICIRKMVPLKLLKTHHEVAFPIFLQIGVIYGVFLAFVFSIEWGEYIKAQDHIDREATTLLVLMHAAQAFPAPYKQAIENGIIDYTLHVIHVDWKDMLDRKKRLNTWGVLSPLQKTYLDFDPQSKQERYLYEDSLKNLEKLREYRQLRIFRVQKQAPIQLWVTLIVMGIVIVAISLLFGMRYVWTQAILISVLTGTIATLIGVTIELNTPFSGRFPLKPTNFENVLSKFEELKRQELLNQKLNHLK